MRLPSIFRCSLVLLSDLSGAGIITNGFTSQDASQVALLQRTIDTVNEVNTT